VRVQAEHCCYDSPFRGTNALTLIVANFEDGVIWMVGDTRITGGTLGTRERESMPKIIVGRTFPALIAFAGGPEHGSTTAEAAALAATPDAALALLATASTGSGTEFAYAASHEGRLRLNKVDDGKVVEISALHIGSASAFNDFQRIRHGEVTPYAAKAFKNLMGGVEGSAVLPKGLLPAIGAMLDLFALRPERDVGGWAVPYVLSESQVSFCSYAYSVSDPVFDELVPGSLIAHGTPELGGATLSVTGFPDNSGMVVYWLQLPGGVVLTRSDHGYDQRRFAGTPTEFRAAVRQALALDVHLWIDDRPAGPVRALHVLRGEDGQVDAVIANHGGPLTIAVHNLANPFQGSARLPLNGHYGATLPNGLELARISDRVVELRVNGEALSLDASAIDNLLTRLAEVRLGTLPEIPAEIRGTSAMVIPDPAWRTQAKIHPDLPGVQLSLRHSGYGWLSFILPDHEAFALGRWFVDCIEAKEREAADASSPAPPPSEPVL
jgi:hypothetical protein